MKDFRLLINGELVDGASTFEVLNPATEEVLAIAPRASADQLDEAVAAAARAFRTWSQTSIEERRTVLVAIADALAADAPEMARLLTMEQGKPLAEAQGEIGATEMFIREIAKLDMPDKVLEESPERRVTLRRRPLGVVGAIIPWNFPMMLMSFKLSPALLAGNTIILKPAPTTPLTTLRFGALIAKIAPAGVVNVITDQNDLGARLTIHPDVAKISFTGSTETGRKVMASAAATIKRLTLELGGNDAAIVLSDVDVKQAAKGIFDGAFLNAGQVCVAIKRVYVHDSIYDEMCLEMTKLAEEAVVDDGLSQGTQIGPLQNRMQYEKVCALIEEARSEGTVLTGGMIQNRKGYFIRPTIVRDIKDGSRLVDEEQFGPVLPLVSYSSTEDALASANASALGLGGSIWSTDREQARSLARRMVSGTVWINKHLDIGPHIPFGGAKQSGLGMELGNEGLLEFTQFQVINETVDP